MRVQKVPYCSHLHLMRQTMLSTTRRAVLQTRPRHVHAGLCRRACYSSKLSDSEAPKPSTAPKVYEYKKPDPVQETRLATYLKNSPRSMAVFKSVMNVLGTGNPRQVGGRVTHHYYQETCAVREIEEREFWHKECHLPPTFQTWFTVTNLHVWLLTVRLRALPPPFGDSFVQGLIDHFFLDIEDRLRQVLSKKAPERLVSRQMKVFREQWAGLGLSLDYAFGLSIPSSSSSSSNSLRGLAYAPPGSDAEFAAAVWRNFLGARGARGIDDPGRVRHAFNIGGEYGQPKLSKDAPEESLRKLENTDDLSGVHDFIGEDVKLYVKYPELMYTLVGYMRRELIRLEGISDQQILEGKGVGKFGKIVERDL